MADADVAIVDTSISAELTADSDTIVMGEVEAVNMEDETPAPKEEENNSADDTEVIMEESVKEDDEVKVEEKTSELAATPAEPINPSTKSEEIKEEEVTDDTSSPVTKAITIAEDEVEDDIICLDEEDAEADADGVSNSKRRRKIEDDDDIMEVDENGIVSKEEKESVGNVVRKMSRQDLEDLVLAKIVEAIVAHTEVGQLRAKVLELQMQKDKMANKMGVMLKQVAELSNAVSLIMDNEKRDPKTRIGKPHVIRFNRSVGLQTIIEPSMRSAPPKIIRVPENAQSQPKQYGGLATGKSVNGTFVTPQQPVKRVYQGSGNKGNEKMQNAASPRKTYSAVQANPRMLPIAPKPPTSQVTITPTQNVQPGIVDLTDDDPPPSSNAQTGVGAQTTIINGVPYQILNSSTTVAGRTAITPSGGAPKYILASAGGAGSQNRQIVLNVGSGPQSQAQQQVVYRGNNITVIPKPVGPRPNGNNVNVPRGGAVAATIRPTGGVLSSTNSQQRRFVLPPLPPTPAPKAKNDFFKPPPKPELTLNEQADGIVLSWNLPNINTPAEVTTYQIFACQESLNSSTLRPSQWKRVGDVKALPLPMACTLSQFTEENRYYFIVRGIDVYGRTGPFCDPQNIVLRRKK